MRRGPRVWRTSAARRSASVRGSGRPNVSRPLCRSPGLPERPPARSPVRPSPARPSPRKPRSFVPPLRRSLGRASENRRGARWPSADAEPRSSPGAPGRRPAPPDVVRPPLLRLKVVRSLPPSDRRGALLPAVRPLPPPELGRLEAARPDPPPELRLEFERASASPAPYRPVAPPPSRLEPAEPPGRPRVESPVRPAAGRLSPAPYRPVSPPETLPREPPGRPPSEPPLRRAPTSR